MVGYRCNLSNYGPGFEDSQITFVHQYFISKEKFDANPNNFVIPNIDPLGRIVLPYVRNAGPSSNGNNAPGTPFAYTPGAAVTGGGAGGQGDTTNGGGGGQDGFAPGGAGGLAMNDYESVGQSGAAGKVILYYT